MSVFLFLNRFDFIKFFYESQSYVVNPENVSSEKHLNFRAF